MKQQHVLVTGVTGFVGRHVVDALLEAGHVVHGLGRDAPASLAKNLATIHLCDMTDGRAVQMLQLPKIDVVIHLANHASQAQSFAEPEKFLTENPLMLKNLHATLQAQNQAPRVLVVSSGAVYDNTAPMPLTEESPTRPSSPYVESKLKVEALAREYRQQGLDYVIARPFNHTGPGQALGYIVPDIFAQAKEAAQNHRPLLTGNLKTRRDYTDVRDVARAYVLLATTPELDYDIYNIASGKSTSGEELLQLILNNVDGGGTLTIQTDPSKIRPQDPPEIYGSFERLHTATGWEPSIPLAQTIADFAVSST